MMPDNTQLCDTSEWDEGLRGEGEAKRRLVFDYWRECEVVAMHLNDKILMVRVRYGASLGLLWGLAVAVVTALRGRVSGDAGLPLVVVAAGVLVSLMAYVQDAYYRRLLHGAVAEITRIENSDCGKSLGLTLSRQIAAYAEKHHESGPRINRFTANTVYACGTVASALLGLILYAHVQQL